MALPELPPSHQAGVVKYLSETGRAAIAQRAGHAVQQAHTLFNRVRSAGEVTPQDLRELRGLSEIRTQIQTIVETAPVIEDEAPAGQRMEWLTDPVMIEQIRAEYEGRAPRIVADVEPIPEVIGAEQREQAFLGPVFEFLNLFTALGNLFGNKQIINTRVGEGAFSVLEYTPESIQAQLNGRLQMARLYAVSGDVLPAVEECITEAEMTTDGQNHQTFKRGQGIVLVFYPPAGDARVTRRPLKQVIIQDGLYAEGADNHRLVLTGKEVVDRYGGYVMVYLPKSVAGRLGLSVFTCDFVFDGEGTNDINDKTMTVTARLDVAPAHTFMTGEKERAVYEEMARLEARHGHEKEIAAGGVLQITTEGTAAVRLLVLDSVTDEDPTPNAGVALNKELWPGSAESVRVKDGRVTIAVNTEGNVPGHSYGIQVFYNGQSVHFSESAAGQYTFTVTPGGQYDVRVVQLKSQSQLEGASASLEGLLADTGGPGSPDVPMQVIGSETETAESIQSRKTLEALARIQAGATSSYTEYGLGRDGRRYGGYGRDSDLGIASNERIDAINLAELRTALARKGGESNQIAWATNRIRKASLRSSYIGGAFELISATSHQPLESLYAKFGSELIAAAAERGSFETRVLSQGTRLFSVSARSQESVTNLELAGELTVQVTTIDIHGFKIEVAMLPCRNLAILGIHYEATHQTVHQELVVLGRTGVQQGWFEQRPYAERGERTTVTTQQRQPLPYAPLPQNVNNGNVLSLINQQSQRQLQTQEQQMLQQMWNNIPIDIQIQLINQILNQNTNTLHGAEFRLERAIKLAGNAVSNDAIARLLEYDASNTDGQTTNVNSTDNLNDPEFQEAELIAGPVEILPVVEEDESTVPTAGEPATMILAEEPVPSDSGAKPDYVIVERGQNPAKKALGWVYVPAPRDAHAERISDDGTWNGMYVGTKAERDEINGRTHRQTQA